MQAFPKSTEKRKNFVTIQKNTPKIKHRSVEEYSKRKKYFLALTLGKKSAAITKTKTRISGDKYLVYGKSI